MPCDLQQLQHCYFCCLPICNGRVSSPACSFCCFVQHQRSRYFSVDSPRSHFHSFHLLSGLGVHLLIPALLIGDTSSGRILAEYLNSSSSPSKSDLHSNELVHLVWGVNGDKRAEKDEAVANRNTGVQGGDVVYYSYPYYTPPSLTPRYDDYQLPPGAALRPRTARPSLSLSSPAMQTFLADACDRIRVSDPATTASTTGAASGTSTSSTPPGSQVKSEFRCLFSAFRDWVEAQQAPSSALSAASAGVGTAGSANVSFPVQEEVLPSLLATFVSSPLPLPSSSSFLPSEVERDVWRASLGFQGFQEGRLTLSWVSIPVAYRLGQSVVLLAAPSTNSTNSILNNSNPTTTTTTAAARASPAASFDDTLKAAWSEWESVMTDINQSAPSGAATGFQTSHLWVQLAQRSDPLLGSSLRLALSLLAHLLVMVAYVRSPRVIVLTLLVQACECVVVLGVLSLSGASLGVLELSALQLARGLTLMPSLLLGQPFSKRNFRTRLGKSRYALLEAFPALVPASLAQCVLAGLLACSGVPALARTGTIMLVNAVTGGLLLPLLLLMPLLMVCGPHDPERRTGEKAGGGGEAMEVVDASSPKSNKRSQDTTRTTHESSEHNEPSLWWLWWNFGTFRRTERLRETAGLPGVEMAPRESLGESMSRSFRSLTRRASFSFVSLTGTSAPTPVDAINLQASTPNSCHFHSFTLDTFAADGKEPEVPNSYLFEQE